MKLAKWWENTIYGIQGEKWWKVCLAMVFDLNCLNKIGPARSIGTGKIVSLTPFWTGIKFILALGSFVAWQATCRTLTTIIVTHTRCNKQEIFFQVLIMNYQILNNCWYECQGIINYDPCLCYYWSNCSS